MIVIINLERLSGDGYKMNANSPLEDTPSYITHAQLRYTPFTSSEAIQGTFVTGALSTVEFSVTGGNLTRLLKLYTSTDGTTYTENKSWGGTDGIRQREYLVYSATLLQLGTNAPTPNVLENTLGTVTNTYVDVGSYGITSSALFTSGKTFFIMGGKRSLPVSYVFNVISSSLITLLSYTGTDLANDIMSNIPIEIRVYP